MKKIMTIVFTVVAVLSISVGMANATIYTYQPIPANLNEMNHGYYYSWAVTPNIGAGEEIVSAELIISQIWDQSNDPNNALYIHLLDSPPHLSQVMSSNLTYNVDGTASVVDQFAGAGPMVGEFHHLPTTWATRTTLDMNFGWPLLLSLRNFAADNSFGFGFDPDCHFANQGVTLRIETRVAEPMSLMVLGAGLVGVAFFTRRRKNSQV